MAFLWGSLCYSQPPILPSSLGPPLWLQILSPFFALCGYVAVFSQKGHQGLLQPWLPKDLPSMEKPPQLYGILKAQGTETPGERLLRVQIATRSLGDWMGKSN